MMFLTNLMTLAAQVCYAICVTYAAVYFDSTLVLGWWLMLPFFVPAKTTTVTTVTKTKEATEA